MADITNAEAIKFSNESLRPGANLLGQMYYRLDAVRDRWASLPGTTAEKRAVMQGDIKLAADAVRAAWKWALDRESLWFLGVNALLPDTADLIADGAGADGRPVVTGAKANRIIDRFRQIINYVRKADFDSFASGDYPSTILNRVLIVCSDGPITTSDADALNFIDIATTIANRYEANTNLELNTILAYANNPNPFVA